METSREMKLKKARKEKEPFFDVQSDGIVSKLKFSNNKNYEVKQRLEI